MIAMTHNKWLILFMYWERTEEQNMSGSFGPVASLVA